MGNTSHMRTMSCMTSVRELLHLSVLSHWTRTQGWNPLKIVFQGVPASWTGYLMEGRLFAMPTPLLNNQSEQNNVTKESIVNKNDFDHRT